MDIRGSFPGHKSDGTWHWMLFQCLLTLCSYIRRWRDRILKLSLHRQKQKRKFVCLRNTLRAYGEKRYSSTHSFPRHKWSSSGPFGCSVKNQLHLNSRQNDGMGWTFSKDFGEKKCLLQLAGIEPILLGLQLAARSYTDWAVEFRPQGRKKLLKCEVWNLNDLYP